MPALLCDEWQSPACRRWCPTCQNRPKRPSQAKDLDLAPREIHPDYNLNTDDEGALLRRVVLPVVRGTLPDGAVRDIKITKRRSASQEHWPRNVPLPEDVYCELTLDTGEHVRVYLTRQGHVTRGSSQRRSRTASKTIGARAPEAGESAVTRYRVPPPALP